MLRRPLLTAVPLLAASRAFGWFPHTTESRLTTGRDLTRAASTGRNPDGFADAIWLPDQVWVNPDVTTSTRLMSGFTRGSGTWTYIVANAPSARSPRPSGAAFLRVSVDSTTETTSYFTVYITGAGADAVRFVGGTGQYPFNVAVTANNGTVSYRHTIAFNVTPGNNDVALPGGNVLPATQSPVSGAWTFNGGATVPRYTYPTPATTGDTPIPNSRFPTYVRFAGDRDNNNTLGNAARANLGSTPPTPPCFFAGFWRAEANTTFGGICGYGNEGEQAVGGAMLLILEGYSTRIVQWSPQFGSEAGTLASGPYEWQVGGRPQPYVLGQWNFSALIFNSTATRSFFQDGLVGTQESVAVPWVKGVTGSEKLSFSFGSDRNAVPNRLGQDAHVFSGGLRDWVCVSGTPTKTELEAMRAGANPLTIWPGRVLGYWRFTANPQLGQTEPDLSGNGQHLTYYDFGTQPGHALPYLVTAGVPWLMDGSGLFQLADVSGGWKLRTTSKVSSLSAVYGRYDVIMVSPNGFQFATTLFVTSGA